MPGYVEIDLKQIPGEVYALMGSGKLVISIGKDEFNMTNMTANAGGALGYESVNSRRNPVSLSVR